MGLKYALGCSEFSGTPAAVGYPQNVLEMVLVPHHSSVKKVYFIS